MSRILVVEDDDDIREFVAGVLTDEGHEVRAAANGRAGLDAMADWQPALVLLDMRMPVLDGRGFAEALWATPAPHPRVLVMTAARDAALAAAAVGAHAYLSKPFDLDDLLARVRSLAG